MSEVASLTEHFRYAWLTGTFCHVESETQIDFGGLLRDHSVNGKVLAIQYDSAAAKIGPFRISDIQRGYAFDAFSGRISPFKSRECPIQTSLAQLRMTLCNSQDEIVLRLRNSYADLIISPHKSTSAHSALSFDIISSNVLYHVTLHAGSLTITDADGEALYECQSPSLRTST